MAAERYMSRALELAISADLARDTNPIVGAVIVDDAGNIVGEGFHNGSGSAHAEVVAIAQAGEKAKGATLYCTLEPCNAQGKTGPCAQAIIAAGISKVIIAQRDPNVAMAGGARAGRHSHRRAAGLRWRRVFSSAGHRSFPLVSLCLESLRCC